MAENKKALQTKKSMKQMEKKMKNNIMGLNSIFQLAALETWDKERIAKYGEIRDKIVTLYFTLLSLHRLVTRTDFSPAYPISLLQPVNTEILQYMDQTIGKSSSIHGLYFPNLPKIYEWPKSDLVDKTVENVHNAHGKLAKDFMELGDIAPTTPVLHNSSLMTGTRSIITTLSELVTKFEQLSPVSKFHAYKVLSQAYISCFIYGVTTFYNDLGFGFFAAFCQEKPFKDRLKFFSSNLRWRYPLCYSLCISTALPWMIYIFEHHGETLHIDYFNRSWILTSPIITIIPAMGGTLNRGFHRIVGTIIGACVGYLMGWGILAAGDPHGVSRWVVMQVLFTIMMFFSVLIQQVPKTGYAAFLAPLTAFLVIAPSLHSPVDQLQVTYFTTRLIVVTITTLWAMLLFCVFIPRKSMDNVEVSIIDSLCTTGKAFATIMNKGLMYNSNSRTYGLDEETRTELVNAFKVLSAAYQSTPILLQDTRFEAWIFRKRFFRYRDIVKQSREVYIMLSSLLMAYGNGFSHDEILKILASLSPSLIAASFPIEHKVTEIITLREATAMQKNSIKAIWKSTQERVGGVDKDEWNETLNEQQPIKYKKILDDLTIARKQYWDRRKSISEESIPIEFLRLCAFLARAERFVNEWDKLRKLVLHIKFQKHLGVEALGKRDDILLQNLPTAEIEAPEDLVKSYSIQNANQANILSEENKGGYFS